jgi:N-acetylmuramic acid 6-phosphate etherase
MLGLLGVVASAESADYVDTKTQFQLQSLLTESRHPRTYGLSGAIGRDTADGLGQILSVDHDVSAMIGQLGESAPDAESRLAKLTRLATAFARAMRDGHRIYFYGCGATGRLAKQVESALWRPLWVRLKSHATWPTIRQRALSASLAVDLDTLEQRLVRPFPTNMPPTSVLVCLLCLTL